MEGLTNRCDDMEIYVVQAGDTLNSIALKLGITVEKLVEDNGLSRPYILVVGQTLVITRPLQVYTVQTGDTLASIAQTFEITINQLLINNPRVASRQNIYQGETLVIRYNNNKGRVWVSGFTYPFISNETLNMTLPSLTYLLIINYLLTSDGEFIGGDEDIEVIRTANFYRTATTMLVSAFSPRGEINLETVYNVLLNDQIQDKIVENLVYIFSTKGYTGVNLSFQFITRANQQLYINYLNKIYNRLHGEGYKVFITINPGMKYDENGISFEQIDYDAFSIISDGILFLPFQWATLRQPPIPDSLIISRAFLDYIVARIPLEKIRVVVPTLGYDWQLPYVQGRTIANVLNFSSALALARETNSVINYDEATLSAYFEYLDRNNNQHIVWFKDARSIDASIEILQSYGIEGIGIWNIMYYFTQMWNVIKTQYQIIKLDINR